MENPINPWMIWGYHYFRKHPYDDVIPMLMTLVCPGGLSDTVTHLLKIWWTSCDGLGAFHVARAGANGVYNSSWEGLLPALFASWLKIFEMTWNDMIWNDMKGYEMTWYEMIWYEMIHRTRCKKLVTFWHFFNFGSSWRRVDVAQLRPLEATVEDAETQLCQNLEGFLVSNQRFSASKILVVLVLSLFHGWLSTTTTRNCNSTTWYDKVYQNYNQCISVL